MDFLKEARKYEQAMIADLRQLIAIESVRDQANGGPGMPFGPNIAKCLNTFLEIGKRDGFAVENVDGYAGVVSWGDCAESVGLLGHLDVVPVGDVADWHYPPLAGEVVDGFIMGRGSADDKGPTIAAYYAMKILKEQGYKLKHNIQLIVGTDEENLSEGILYYKKHRKAPLMGIVPDADFPCIYAEKGILDFLSYGKIDSCITHMDGGTAYNVVIGKAKATVNQPLLKNEFEHYCQATKVTGACFEDENGAHYEVVGKPFHASKPYLGVNAAVKLFNFIGVYHQDEFSQKMVQLFESPYGEGLKVDFEGAYMGHLTFNLGKVSIADGEIQLCLDYRYPNECDGQDLFNRSKQIIAETCRLDTVLVDDSKWLLADPNSELVRTCLKHYQAFSQDTYTPPLRIGGGTYARSFENFVACGPVFPTRPYPSWVGNEHEVDEGFEIETMLLACAVYANILVDLACE